MPEARPDADSAPRPAQLPSFHVRPGQSDSRESAGGRGSSESILASPGLWIGVGVLLMAIGTVSLVGWFVFQDRVGHEAAAPIEPHVPTADAARLVTEGRGMLTSGRGWEAVTQFYQAQKADPLDPEARRLGYEACEFVTLQALAAALPPVGTAPEAPAAVDPNAAGATGAPVDAAPTATEAPPPATAPTTTSSSRDRADRPTSVDTRTTTSTRTASPTTPATTVTAPPAPTTSTPTASASDNPTDRALNYILDAGQKEYDKGNLAKAVQKWETLLAADPSHATPQFYQAGERIQRAKDAMKEQSKASFTAALTAMKSGQWKTARVQLEKTLSIDPYNETAQAKLDEVREHLEADAQDLISQGKAREDSGDKELAIDYYQQALDLVGSADPLGQKAAKRIAALKEP